jgi:phospholipase C
MLYRLSVSACALAATTACATVQAGSNDANTTTPIKHVIVVIGENHTFDSLFATYQPKTGEHIRNLLSEGIVKVDGSAGPNYSQAVQRKASNPGTRYTLDPTPGSTYTWLPQPEWEFGIPDLRFPFWLAPGPFQITRYVPYSGVDSITGDPVHRFFQMWQQTGGTNQRHDLFVWTATTTGQGGDTSGLTSANPKQGGELMGFYNMAKGDAAYFKSLADNYAISDNYHQAIMGGTGMNFFAIATGDLPVYQVGGQLMTPPANQIENPDPLAGTANFFTRDGYSGGSWVNCADRSQPGVAAVRDLLDQEGVPHNCVEGAYHLVNNYNPPYDVDGHPVALGSDKYVYPPQTVPTIAEALSAKDVSWRWYTGGRETADATLKIFGQSVGSTLGQIVYNNIGDPLNGSKNVVESPLRQNLVGMNTFYKDLAANSLPAVSYVVPANLDAGHPGNSAPAYYENFVSQLVKDVQAHPALWAQTAIIVTTDEGGGFFDTGRIQQLDFFGDGPRIPLFVVSPYAKRGHVDHVYQDHASILKFIERNWGLAPLSGRSRDRLPNPVSGVTDPYMPVNAPAIGDLTSLFNF